MKERGEQRQATDQRSRVRARPMAHFVCGFLCAFLLVCHSGGVDKTTDKSFPRLNNKGMDRNTLDVSGEVHISFSQVF